MAYITENSPSAQELKHKAAAPARTVYLFDTLEAGKSQVFQPEEKPNVLSLRALASRKSIDGKLFKVVTHPNGLVELARLL